MIKQRIFSAAVLSSALLAMGGCASVANKDDVYLLKTEMNEEISSLKLNVQRLQEQVQDLTKQVDFVKTDTNNQLTNLSADVSSRLGAVESARAKDKEEVSKKFNVVIDEVSGSATKRSPKSTSTKAVSSRKAVPAAAKETAPDVEPATAAATTQEKESSTTPPAGSTTYVVRTGDTISKIARHFGVTPQELMEANGLQDPNQIGIGSNLIIPKAGETSPAPTVSKAEIPAPTSAE